MACSRVNFTFTFKDSLFQSVVQNTHVNIHNFLHFNQFLNVTLLLLLQCT